MGKETGNASKQASKIVGRHRQEEGKQQETYKHSIIVQGKACHLLAVFLT